MGFDIKRIGLGLAPTSGPIAGGNKEVILSRWEVQVSDSAFVGVDPLEFGILFGELGFFNECISVKRLSFWLANRNSEETEEEVIPVMGKVGRGVQCQGNIVRPCWFDKKGNIWGSLLLVKSFDGKIGEPLIGCQPNCLIPNSNIDDIIVWQTILGGERLDFLNLEVSFTGISYPVKAIVASDPQYAGAFQGGAIDNVTGQPITDPWLWERTIF